VPPSVIESYHRAISKYEIHVVEPGQPSQPAPDPALAVPSQDLPDHG